MNSREQAVRARPVADKVSTRAVREAGPQPRPRTATQTVFQAVFQAGLRTGISRSLSILVQMSVLITVQFPNELRAHAVPKRAEPTLNLEPDRVPALQTEPPIGREPVSGVVSPTESGVKAVAEIKSHEAVCDENLEKISGGAVSDYTFFCRRSELMSECMSQEGRPIQHLDLHGKDGDLVAKRERRILVFGTIHGDEPLSGRLALEWAKRLREIEPRNVWRVVPFLNPDGLRRNTRVNARNVDLNRNFPTRDWEKEAIKNWETFQRKDPRRFPGPTAASESETQCAIAQINAFKPDFIVSIHTPYAVLDFDGPKLNFPAYKPLPWRSLGNFPGSLGRYMWKDNNRPVLTIELKDRLVEPSQIQDVVGKLAIDASKATVRRGSNSADLL